MHELTVLQAVRLKGRVTIPALVETLRAAPAAVTAAVDELGRAGLVVADEWLRLSDAGRVRCDELLAAERAAVDAGALAAAYQAFGAVNADLKAAVTNWQLTRDDDVVLARLGDIHRRIMPIIAAAAVQLPRLTGYADKLEAALGRVLAGDTGFLTRPAVDSYHTVWFELHEELLQACGLTRRSDD